MASNLSFNVAAFDAASKVFEKVADKLDGISRRIDRLDGKTAELDVETKEAERKVGAFARNLQTDVRAAINSLPDIELGADASMVDKRIAIVRKQLVELSGKTIGIDISDEEAQRKVRDLTRELKILGAESPDIHVRVNTSEAINSLGRMEAAASKAGKSFGGRFGDQAMLSINQRVKLWGSLIVAGAAPSGAAAGAAIATGFATGLIAASAAASATSGDIKNEFENLKEGALIEVRALGQGTSDLFVTQMQRLRGGFQGVGSDIASAVNEAEPAVTSLTGGLLDFAGNALPGFLAAVRNSGPTMAGFRVFLSDTGTSVGNLGNMVARNAETMGASWVHLSGVVQTVLGLVNRAVEGSSRAFVNHGGEINSLLTNISTVATNLGSGAFPVLGSGISFVIGALNGLLGILGPVSGQLGTVAGIALTTWGAFKAANMARGWMESLGGSISGFADRTSVAGTRTGRFAGMLGNLVSAGAGPLGIALAAVGGVLALFGMKQAEAAQKVAEHKQRVSELTSALEQSNGALDENVRRSVAKSLQNTELSESTGNAVDGFKRFDLSLRQVTSAVTQGGAPFDALRSKLVAVRTENTNSNNVQAKTKQRYNQTGQAANELIGILDSQRNSVKAAQDQFRQLTNATAGADDGISKINEKLKDFAEAAGDAEKRGQAYKELLDELRGKTMSVAEQQAKWGDALRELKELNLKNAYGIDLATGKINAQSEAGGDLVEWLTGKALPGFAALADSMYQEGRSADEVTAALKRKRKGLIDTLVQMGFQPAAAKRIADAYGLIPEEVSTNVKAKNISGVDAAITALRGKILDVTGSNEIILDADDKAAIDTLTALGLKVKTLPGGKVAVYADDIKAQQTLDTLVARINGTSGEVNIFANTQPGTLRLGQLVAKINASKGVTKIDGDTAPGDKKRGNFKIRIDTTRGVVKIDGDQKAGRGVLKDLIDRVNRSKGWTKINARDGLARDEVERLKAWIGRQEASIRLKVARPAMNLGFDALGLPSMKDFFRGMADGGIVERYATGGVRQMRAGHAERVPPNSLRVIGDRAKDDESYIPINRSQQSIALLAETAQRMGFNLVRMFAGGGIAKKPAGATPAAPSVAVSGSAPAAGGGGVVKSAAALGGTAGTLTATMGELDAATQAYASTVSSLSSSALAPLEQQMASRTIPNLQRFGEQTVLTGTVARTAWQQTTNRVVANQNQLQNRQTVLGQGMRQSWNNIAVATQGSVARQRQQYGGLQQGMGNTQQRQTVLAGGMRNSWNNIATHTAGSVNRQRQSYGGLQTGMANTRSAMNLTASVAGRAFSRVETSTKNPLRRTISQAINAGIIRAYNHLNAQFRFGRAVPNAPITFAQGGKYQSGKVHGPGTGTSDSIFAGPWLSDDEFVVRARITRATEPFLRALNRGEPEALQAAGAGKRRIGLKRGGMVADTGSAANAALARGVRFARGESGKPYIWGGVGPAGYDCSGFMSAITNVLRGQNPHRRLGVARSQPWGGFSRGLKGAFATGFSNVHTAGTLAGTNVESGGSPSKVKFGAGAAGADDGQFPGHAWLPFVGGKFVSGGDGAFDPTPMVRQAFAGVPGMINSLLREWPGNIAAKAGAGVASQANQRVQAFALRKAMAMFAGGGAAGSPAVTSAVRAVAAGRGWGSGPQWDALSWIISHESGWDPGAANPTSSARGLFQKMTSVHGPVEGSPAGQAQWGINYIASRYGNPINAKRFWQANGHYADGALITKPTYGLVGEAGPELILPLSRPRRAQALLAEAGLGGSPVTVHHHHNVFNFTKARVDSQDIIKVLQEIELREAIA